MLEPDTPLWYAAIVASGLLLYMLFWWMVSGLPSVARWMARIVVLLIVVVPLALMLLVGNEPRTGAPAASRAPSAQGGTSERDGPRELARPPRDPSKEDAASPRPDRDRTTERRFEQPRPSAPPTRGPTVLPPEMTEPSAGGSMQPPPPGPRITGTAPPEAQSVPRPTPPPTAQPSSPARSSRAPEPSMAPPAPTPPARREAAPAATPGEDWTVVPVLYGTDRNRRDRPKRIDYGADRARRLELGIAEVTIPKLHQVPNIERPWAIRVPILDITLWEASEDPKYHFTIRSVQVRTREEFIALAKARLANAKRYEGQALVFIHGYNNGFDTALYRTAQIAYDIDFDGVPMLYSWPSGGNYTSYAYDRESSVQAEPMMRQFLEMVVRETSATSVNIVAHSMGNVPLLGVLRDLKRSLPEGVRLNQIVLAAPDVDRDIFTNLAEEIRGVAKGLTLYASSNDNALIAARQVAGGVPRAGEVPPEGPLVLLGIDTIDVSLASTDVLAMKHNTYAERKELLEDIAALFRTGVRPPGSRLPFYETVTTPRGDYWRFPAR